MKKVSINNMEINLVSKVGIVLILATVIGCNINAQDRPPHPPGMPDSLEIVKMVDELSVKLNLSGEQRKSIEQIHLDHFKEVKSEREAEWSLQEQKRIARDARRIAFENQVKDLLSPEQQTKFDAYMQNHRPPMQNKKCGPR